MLAGWITYILEANSLVEVLTYIEEKHRKKIKVFKEDGKTIVELSSDYFRKEEGES